MAHGECLSRRPCKDCYLRFFSTIRQRSLFGALLLSKQVGGQARLPCLYPHSGKRSLLEEVFDSVYKTAFCFANLRSRLRFRLLYFLFCRFRRLLFGLTYIGDFIFRRKCRHTDCHFSLLIFDGHRGEFVAKRESILSNAPYAVRDSNRGEFVAPRESRISNARYAVRDGDRGEFFAIFKSRMSNARYAGRDGDRGESIATRESTISNARYAVRDGNRGESTAITESTISNARYAVRDGNRGESIAAIESTLSNARYAVRDYV